MKPAEGRCYGLPENTVENILGILASYPAIEAVIRYGSRAKGNFQGSDIDLCLLVPILLNLTQQLEIKTRLDDLPLPKKIDLVLKHNADNAA